MFSEIRERAPLADPLERDDDFAPPAPRVGGIAARAFASLAQTQGYLEGLNAEPVSYTHLTLPTILLV